MRVSHASIPCALPLLVLAQHFAPHESIEFELSPLPKAYELDPFYAKHVDVRGFPVLSSTRVPDQALFEAAYLVDRMLVRDDVREALIERKVRFAVMAHDELTTAIPEHSDLEPARYWDRRARGLGATPWRPAVSCGAENLLGYSGDPYAAENILIHEFAHAIHGMGMKHIDRTFQPRLEKAYAAAMEAGLYAGKYAATNVNEYWAEGVQSFFDTNRENDADHNHVDTREELEEYDRALFALVAEVFPGADWRYVKPADRAEPGHLAGWDATSAPRFEWPADLEAWYREYEAKQREGEGGR
ncbi:MAG: hypothetical protein AAF726_20125 [Planctomycetota bacterium]